MPSCGFLILPDAKSSNSRGSPGHAPAEDRKQEELSFLRRSPQRWHYERAPQEWAPQHPGFCHLGPGDQTRALKLTRQTFYRRVISPVSSLLSRFWWRPASLDFLFGATSPQSQPLLTYSIVSCAFVSSLPPKVICYTGVKAHWNLVQPAPGIYPPSRISRCLQVPRVRKPTHAGEWKAIQPTTATVTSLLSAPQSLRSPAALNLRTQFIKNVPAWDGSNVENHRIGGTQQAPQENRQHKTVTRKRRRGVTETRTTAEG